MQVLLLVAASLSLAGAQFLQTFEAPTLSVAIQPPPLQQTFQPVFPVETRKQPRVLAHRAVVINAENEAKLPAELINDFYKNPRIVQALAKESWFGPGEEQVINREADKIPRAQIFKLIRQAGFVKRR